MAVMQTSQNVLNALIPINIAHSMAKIKKWRLLSTFVFQPHPDLEKEKGQRVSGRGGEIAGRGLRGFLACSA
jgi:hypothetical protein